MATNLTDCSGRSLLVCWLIRRMNTVQTPDQTSRVKRNMNKYFFDDCISAAFWQKLCD